MSAQRHAERSRLVGEDPRFRIRIWRFQHLGWAFMPCSILLALVGALGGGPLARAEGRDGPLSAARAPDRPVLRFAAPGEGVASLRLSTRTDAPGLVSVEVVHVGARAVENDILQTARETRGLPRMEDVRLAVLEPSGVISIVPREGRE